MHEQDNNPFRPPRQVGQAQGRSSFMYVFACLVWCGLAIKVTIFRPVVRSFFEEFEIALPVLTTWLLHPIQTWLFLASAIAVLSAGVIVRTGETRYRVGRISLMIAVVVLLLIIFGIALPLLWLIEALS